MGMIGSVDGTGAKIKVIPLTKVKSSVLLPDLGECLGQTVPVRDIGLVERATEFLCGLLATRDVQVCKGD